MDEQSLINHAAEIGIALDEERAALLVAYGKALLLKNQTINLTAIRDEDEFLVKHLLDSLTVASLPEIAGKLADIGTGGGFPGVVIRIMHPDLPMTLADSVRKKLFAVAEICNGLNISVKTIHMRAEEMGQKEFRDHFDTVTARAVAAMPQLLEYCLPLVKVGGHFLAMKGPECEQEIKDAEHVEKVLGGELVRKAEFLLPGGQNRVIAVYRKVQKTPKGYPRSAKRIASEPLI